MKINRTQNARRNIVFGLLNKAITLLLPFFVRTIMIKYLGAEFLGLDSLFISVLQVLNLSELGFSSAIVYCMYKPIAENRNDEVCALLNFYRTIYRIIGSVVLVVGIAIIPFLPYFVNSNPGVGGGVPEGVNLYVIYIVYLLNAVIGYFLFAYKNSVPNAIQRIDVVTNINTITKSGLYVVQMMLIICLKDNNIASGTIYYLYILFLPISTLLNNILVSLYVDKRFPQYKCCGHISRTQKQNIKIKVTGLFISRVCQTTRNTLDSICISSFLGLTLTTMYNNYFYVISSLIGIMSVIANSILAGVGNSIVVESREKNYNDMRRMIFVYMWLSGWLTVCLLMMFQPFMKIWMGEKLMFPYGVVICFSLYFYVLKMGDLRGVYSDGAGLWWENRFRAIFESLANIILNITLVRFLGVYGIILATLISLLIINFGFGSQIVFKYYFKNNKQKQYYFDHFKYAFVTGLICFVTYVACENVYVFFILDKFTNETVSNVLTLLVNGLICVILPNVMYFILYRKTKIYKNSLEWFLPKVPGSATLKWALLPRK